MTETLSGNVPHQAPKLSVYIITFNEADKISAAVQSVAWADELLVLDSNSSDDTVKIATKSSQKARVSGLSITQKLFFFYILTWKYVASKPNLIMHLLADAKNEACLFFQNHPLPDH